jgi:hypothetical protein
VREYINDGITDAEKLNGLIHFCLIAGAENAA